MKRGSKTDWCFHLVSVAKCSAQKIIHIYWPSPLFTAVSGRIHFQAYSISRAGPTAFCANYNNPAVSWSVWRKLRKMLGMTGLRCGTSIFPVKVSCAFRYLEPMTRGVLGLQIEETNSAENAIAESRCRVVPQLGSPSHLTMKAFLLWIYDTYNSRH